MSSDGDCAGVDLHLRRPDPRFAIGLNPARDAGGRVIFSDSPELGQGPRGENGSAAMLDIAPCVILRVAQASLIGDRQSQLVTQMPEPLGVHRTLVQNELPQRR